MRIIGKRLIFFTILSLLIACKSTPPRIEPEIQEPELSITSITILQAELVNTRYRFSLKINNPNPFPISLSSFRYELYGNDRFWSDGEEKDLSVVPAYSSSEVNFDCVMNFMGMTRQLLNDIIAMRNVHYRLAGNVEIEAGMTSATGQTPCPVLTMKFDYSGNSEVKK